MKPLRYLIPRSGQTYYVVFDSHRGRKTMWWHYILDPKFMHCFLLVMTSDKETLVINPLHWGIYNHLISSPIGKVVKMYLDFGVTSILECKVKINKKEKFKFRGIYTCVSFIKAVLNLRGMSLSPKRLHNYLLKHGAIRVCASKTNL